MKVWDNIVKWGRGLMQRAASSTGIAREFKDIFELGDVPAFSQFYACGIFVWKALYRGLYKPWHVVPVVAVGAKPNQTRQLFRLNTAKAVSAELASLVWGEEAQFSVSTAGWVAQTDENGVVTNPDPLAGFVEDVLRRNAFGEKLQELIEQGLALGGAAIKVWAEPDLGSREKGVGSRGAPGNSYSLLPTAYSLKLGYCMADQFVPLAWDNAQVTEGVFISRRARKGWYYTRLEWHRWDGGTYVITNELYKADMQRGAQAGQNQDILGVRCPLAELQEMFPGLEPETVIPVEESLFSYWRTPIANNIDDNSPLGVSIYANALETLHAIDICYDSFVTEFRLGKKKIIVPARFLRAVVDPQTGRQVRYFDPNDETYVGVADDDGTAGVHDISVELRVEEHVAALNALLSILCLQIGFSANTFSFDQGAGLKTATEVVSENSKTYKTVKTVQNQLRPMLEHMVRNIIDVAVLYGMQWQGQSVESLAAGGYEVKVTFDDGVTQDRQTNLNEGVMLVGAGLLSKYKFLTDKKFGQGLTDKEAAEELERIKGEKLQTVDDTQVRLFGGGA